MKVEIVRSGIHATVQDLGRLRFRRHGVSTCGALDPLAARMANALVGNPETAAVIETVFGGLRLRFADERIVAWCGASFAVRVGKCELPAGRACRVAGGAALSFAAPAVGLRAWLAVSGGIDVPLALGSRSTDLRAGFGGFDGRLLRAGDALPLGVEMAESRRLHALLTVGEFASWGAPPADLEPILRVVRGSAFAPLDGAFVVTPDSDRMGLRLSGPAVRTNARAASISEPVSPGTIQAPPDGQPIVLLADCQTIGGYPRIAHVITADLPRAAQLRPGDTVRFREVSLEEARALRLASERALEFFRQGLKLRLE